MRRDVIHQLVGYDPSTESLAFECDIPINLCVKVKTLLTPDNDDPEYVYSYPLQWSVAHDIMGIIGVRGAQGLHYYVECFAHA
jgi:hypothetical protein